MPCRLVYMPIRPCLKEMNRVLKGQGALSITAHGLRFALWDLARVIPLLSVRALIGRPWAIVNGLVFVLSGKNYKLPGTRGTGGWESWQTRGSMRRALKRAGFVGFEAPLAFNAQKEPAAACERIDQTILQPEPTLENSSPEEVTVGEPS